MIYYHIVNVYVLCAVNLRNVSELLEFADIYNATQLKTTCHQFIVINLPALLESRLLIQYCHCRQLVIYTPCPEKMSLFLTIALMSLGGFL